MPFLTDTQIFIIYIALSESFEAVMWFSPAVVNLVISAVYVSSKYRGFPLSAFLVFH